MLSPYYTDVTEDRKCKQIFAVAQMFFFPLLPVFGLHWLNTLWKWFSSSPRCKVHCRDGSVPYNVNEKTQEAEIKVTTGGRHWGKSAVSWKCIARAKLDTSCIYFINIKYSATLSHMWMKKCINVHHAVSMTRKSASVFLSSLLQLALVGLCRV